MTVHIEPFFDQRTYTLTFVVWDAATRDAVVIDPVLDYEPVGSFTFTESVDQVSQFIRGKELNLHWVLETHAHADHLSGSQLLKKRFGAGVVISEKIRVVQETFKALFDLPQLATDGSQFDKLVVVSERSGQRGRRPAAQAREQRATLSAPPDKLAATRGRTRRATGEQRQEVSAAPRARARLGRGPTRSSRSSAPRCAHTKSSH
jgi:hypothetical protein